MELANNSLRLLVIAITISVLAIPTRAVEKTVEQSAKNVESGQGSSEPLTEAVISEMISGLEAESFQTRRESFLRLWQAGREALPAIQSAMTSTSALRADAAAMLEVLIRMNVTADKPDEAAEFIAKLTNSPELALVHLCQRGYWKVAEELLETNDTLRENLTMASSAFKRLNALVDEAIKQEDATLAWPILRQVIPLPQAMWIAHKLKLEPPKFDEANPNNQAWAAVARGEHQQAFQLKTSADLKALIALRHFDWMSLIEPSIQRSFLGDRRSVSQMTSNAVLLEYAGKVDESEKIWSAIFPMAGGFAPGGIPLGKAQRDPESRESNPELNRDEKDTEEPAAEENTQPAAPDAKDGFELMTDPAILVALESLQQDPTNLDRVLLCMILTGRGQAVQDYLVKYDPESAWSFCLARGDQQAAIRSLGIADDFSNFDEWVVNRRDLLHKDEGNFFSTKTNFRTTVQLANLLLGLGQTAEADAVYEALVSVAQASRKSQADNWSTLIASMNRAESRARCIRIVRDNYARMNEDARGSVFQSLYAELPTTAAYLHYTAPEITDEDGKPSKWEAIEQLWRWNRSKFEPNSTKTLTNWLRRARNELLDRDLLSAHSLGEFATLANGLGLSDLAFEFASDSAHTNSDIDSQTNLWTQAGSLLLERGELEAAIRYLAAVRVIDGSQQEAILAESNALNMSGKFDEASALEQSRLLRPMNWTIGPYSWFSVAKRASDAEKFELAHEYIAPALRYVALDSDEERNGQVLWYVALQYAEIADGLKDVQLSADSRRLLLVSLLAPNSRSFTYSFYNSIAGKERLNRAILAARANDMPAFERHALVAESMQPQGIELVEDTYHELIASGQQDVAEKLFKRFESRLLVHLERWPLDATSHNNLAWMYARCDRNLDEALKHAEKAVELSPHSAVLLDTLAEVYFKRNQLSQAISAMQHCIELDPRESHLRRQLARFLDAAIASEK